MRGLKEFVINIATIAIALAGIIGSVCIAVLFIWILWFTGSFVAGLLPW